jgi:transcription factor SOX7/8/10/18 (SOX group E/F)
MTEHPNYKYRPRRRKHTKPRTGPQNGNNSAANATSSTNNAGNNNSSSSNANSNGTPSSTPSTHNQSSSEVQYDRMSPYNYNGMYYNDGSTLTSPGQSSPSPSPPNSHGKKLAFKMEDVPTPEMSPMELGENVHSSKIDYEQALPATTTSNFNNNKNRYTYDTSNSYEISTAGQKGAYHYVTNSDRMYESQQHQMTSNLAGDKKSAYSMPLAAAATTATTIAAMGNGMYVMCSNRGVLDQGHVVTGTYFPPLPTSQDHQNLGTNSILTSSSHHHHHHYMNTTQTTSSLAGNQIMSGGNSASNNSNDVKFKSNDNNNNKHGSENNNNNKANKLSEINNGKIEGKNGGGGGGFKSTSGKNGSTGKSDDIDDKLIKNDTNNNNHPDNKNGSNNRLILSSPSAASSASALSPYHHQSYLSQYKNHLNYADHTTTAVIAQSQMQDDGNFTATTSEYDPYHHHQNNPIYYHPTSHFTHSHPSLNTLPPSTSVAASPTTFYVTNPDYYHQSYSMAAPNIQATTNVPTSGVQPMVAKIDAVIGATALHHHPSQNIIHSDPYVVAAEPLKEDDFSNILAGVRKTCYSN